MCLIQFFESFKTPYSICQMDAMLESYDTIPENYLLYLYYAPNWVQECVVF